MVRPEYLIAGERAQVPEGTNDNWAHNHPRAGGVVRADRHIEPTVLPTWRRVRSQVLLIASTIRQVLAPQWTTVDLYPAGSDPQPCSDGNGGLRAPLRLR